MLPTNSPSVDESAWTELLGPALSSALALKGYATLTPVQKSVLDPTLAGHDLRISSQTGSGKTLAIGFVVRAEVASAVSVRGKDARPTAIVIAPTRELAKQVEMELSWLYAPLKVTVAAVTGGASYRDEHRALARGPGIVVGTPGRLLDHLKRGSIDPSSVSAVVLDEADRMLELGFREELEAILGTLPAEHRTHLVSATFAREVSTLANRVQKNVKVVQGTPLGTANVDIDHVIYLVAPDQRVDALINLLLMYPEDQTLVFAHTRADVANITEELRAAGFAADSLSGELEQAARTRALSAFRRGDTRALVATDVAGRGIDVQNITRVIQIDAPSDPDSYTHRSGRTGRAGRKGTSALLVTPAAFKRTCALLGRVGVRYRVQPVPSAEAICAAEDERYFAELSAEPQAPLSPRILALTQKLIEGGFTERALAQLLERARVAGAEPRDVRQLNPQSDTRRPYNDRGQSQYDRGPKPARGPSFRDQGFRDQGPSRPGSVPPRRGDTFRSPSEPPPRRGGGDQWVPFEVSWGAEHGADARRLVAMLCRRGAIKGSDIGAIRVNRTSSSVEIAARVVPDFSAASRAPDPREPRVHIVPLARA
jgi:ATP-dependent RNA helicase DeaD